MLVDGSSSGIGIGNQIFGIELVQENTTIGGTALTQGQFLLTVNSGENVGSNSLSVTTMTSSG